MSAETVLTHMKKMDISSLLLGVCRQKKERILRQMSGRPIFGFVDDMRVTVGSRGVAVRAPQEQK